MGKKIITLKNGQQIELDWNFLILEYLGEYEGGLSALQKDIKDKVNVAKQMKIFNQFLYAIVRANVDEALTYRQAVSLIKMEDTNKIQEFMEDNKDKFEVFKKKEVKYQKNFNPNQKNWKK